MKKGHCFRTGALRKGELVLQEPHASELQATSTESVSPSRWTEPRPRKHDPENDFQTEAAVEIQIGNETSETFLD